MTDEISGSMDFIARTQGGAMVLALIDGSGSFLLGFGGELLDYIARLVMVMAGWFAGCLIVLTIVSRTRYVRIFHDKRSATELALVRLLESHRVEPLSIVPQEGQGALRLILVKPDWVLDKSQEGKRPSVSVNDLDYGCMDWVGTTWSLRPGSIAWKRLYLPGRWRHGVAY